MDAVAAPGDPIAGWLQFGLQRHGRVKIVGFRNVEIPIDLDRVFVPLYVYADPRREGGGPDPREDKDGLGHGGAEISFDDAIARASDGRTCLALIGDPGAGKTTLLRHLFRRVAIPDGHFVMGSSKQPGQLNYDPEAHADELPAHPVQLTGFWMSVYPVTNEQYGRFVAETGRAAPGVVRRSPVQRPRAAGGDRELGGCAGVHGVAHHAAGRGRGAAAHRGRVGVRRAGQRWAALPMGQRGTRRVARNL